MEKRCLFLSSRGRKENDLYLGLVFAVQSLSHVQLCDPMDCSTPGFPLLHYLPEFVQVPVHC